MSTDDNTNNNNNNDDILLQAEELLGSPAKSSKDDKSKQATPDENESLPKEALKFHIPSVVRKKYKKLIPLILQTESMDDKEREYWFQILPIMTSDQVARFTKILINEKKELAKLDAEYEESLKKINKKHLSEWKSFESKQKLEEIEKAEQKEQEKEKSLEQELLDKLQNL